jgi:tetratricopeptide (TPR) repeat protein
LAGCAWLVRLLPELADGPIEPLPSWTLPPEQERRLLFAAVRRVLANAAGPAGTLLALDDLQWAGPDGLELLVRVVRAAGTAPVRVVGAYRDTEAGADDPLAGVLADLVQAGLATHHTLGPLAAEEATSLLAAVLEGAGDERAALRDQVARRSGRVPFFLVSWARALQAGPAAGNPADTLPWDVSQSVRQRARSLSPTARDALGACAVVGRVVPRTLLVALMDRPADELLAALESACRARLLEEQGPDVYRFAHDVIREVVEGDLGAARRAHLHRRVAEALERGTAAPDIETLAYHYARSDEREKAVRYLELAGDHARDRYAHEAAAAYYREAATRLDQLGRAPRATLMREQAGGMLQTAGQHEPALALLERAAQGYEAADDLEGLGRVVASIGKGHYVVGTTPPVQRLEQTLVRLEERDGGRSIVELCTCLTNIYYAIGRSADMLAAAERAVAGARALGDDRLLAEALASRGWALYCWGRQEDALPDLEEARSLADTTGHLIILCDALQTAAGVYGDHGEVERSRAYSDRAVATAERLGDPYELLVMLTVRGLLAYFRGDWTQTRADCERALAVRRGDRMELSQTTAPPAASEQALLPPAPLPRWTTEGLPQVSPAHEVSPRLCLAQLCLAEGNQHEAAQHLEAVQATVLADVNLIMLVQILLAHLDLRTGRSASAQARLVPLAARPGPWESWEWQVTPLLVLLAWAHLDLNETEQAAAVVARAVAQARAIQRPRALVEALWMQARVATRQEQWAQAGRALEEGVAVARAIGYPYGEARLLHLYELLGGSQETSDGAGEQAREQLRAALAIFRRLGARLDASRVEEALGTGLRAAARKTPAPTPQLRQERARDMVIVPEGPDDGRLSRHERQAWALAHLRVHGPLSPGAYARAVAVSADTALLDLRALVASGLVRAEGTSRNRRYVLASHDAP